MIIEFSNTIAPKNHSAMAVAIVATACAFFFIPTTLIILGYYASQPTGTLISPLPQGTLSEQPTPSPTTDNRPVIAAPAPNVAEGEVGPNSATSEVAAKPGSNITDKVATIEANTTETVVLDPDVTETTAVYLSPRPGDKAVYSVRSKKNGEFIINISDTSDIVRYIDYHLVNP